MTDLTYKKIAGMTYASTDESRYDIGMSIKLATDFYAGFNEIKSEIIKAEITGLIRNIETVLRVFADNGVDISKLPSLNLGLTSDEEGESVSIKWETPYLRTGFFLMEDTEESGFFFTSNSLFNGSSFVTPLPPPEDTIGRINAITDVVNLLVINT